MPITNLYADFGNLTTGYQLPIVLWIHGWDGQGADFGQEGLGRMAGYGFFVASLGMRGRDGADGARDASGREVYDIYDALAYIRTNYAAYVSPTLAAVVGYSGGGGNALACACKFPDAFSCIVDFYGMSDYGRDGTNGWRFNNGGTFDAAIETAVGGAPAVVPNNYYARDATAAITNYSAGELCIFHDTEDATVPLIHTTRIKNALDGAGLTNYTLNQSTVGSPVRWGHGQGEVFDSIGMAAKNIWMPLVRNTAAWTIAASGTVTVIGYIVTKRFTIWLNSGLDAAATVAYNTATDTYTVTPLTTAAINVTITQGAKSGSATGITEATQIVVT